MLKKSVNSLVSGQKMFSLSVSINNITRKILDTEFELWLIPQLITKVSDKMHLPLNLDCFVKEAENGLVSDKNRI